MIRADWIAGESDALLEVVARSIAELQRVQLLLSSRGGRAARDDAAAAGGAQAAVAAAASFRHCAT